MAKRWRGWDYYWDMWFWLPVSARVDGLWHLVRGHKLRWRDSFDPWVGITGDIWCEDCPDCDGRSLSIWIRQPPGLWPIMRWVCGRLGHPGWKHPQKWISEDESQDVLDRWYCERCLADRPDATP